MHVSVRTEWQENAIAQNLQSEVRVWGMGMGYGDRPGRLAVYARVDHRADT